MEKVNVNVGEIVSINVFAKLEASPALFVYGYGMKANGVVVIVKAKLDDELVVEAPYTAIGEVYYIKRLRRDEAEKWKNSKAQYGTIMGRCEVHNFFHEHDLPEDAESYILGKVLELWNSYPKAEMVIDIPKETK